MKSPNQFATELARARAAYARARLALDRSRDQLTHVKGRASERRALLVQAKCWGRVGETAARVQQALEATIAEQRKPWDRRSSKSKAKSASAQRYWVHAAPEQRAAHVLSIVEGRRRAAEQRKRRAV